MSTLARFCRSRRARDERGTALLEAAVTIPLLLALAVGIFEFGRAFHVWQVMTNAAREGARMAVVPNTEVADVRIRVRGYLTDAALPRPDWALVNIDRNATVLVNGVAVSSSLVAIEYPFEFIVLQPVARLLNPDASTGAPLTMRAAVKMRNEAQ